MPIPVPSEGESREDFGSRCIPVLVGEGEEQDQASAICFAEFDRLAEAGHTDEEKKKKEAVPEALTCDPPDVTAEEVGAGGAALLHAWAHRLWASGVRGDELLEAHEDAIRAGEAAGLPHEVCDDLDGAAEAKRAEA